MIPTLYEKTETSFTTNGIGRLPDAVSCVVTEERNGIYELEMEYPITGLHYDDLQEARFILAEPSQEARTQPFRIYRISRPIEGIVTVYAEHISYLLNRIVVKPFTASSCADALAKLRTEAINTNPFTFSTDKTTTGTLNVTIPKDARTLMGGDMGSILSRYGTGDYEFDRFSVTLHTNRGTNNGVTIRYGKNITDINRNTNISNCYVGIVPYWQNGDTVVTLPEYVVYSSAHSSDFAYTVIKAVDLSEEWQEQPTESQLRARATKYVEDNEGWVMNDNVRISFAPLWQTEEYKNVAVLERVHMCDTVKVIYEPLGIELTTRVVRTEYDVLRERYLSIDVGSTRNSLADVMTSDLYDTIQTSQANAINTIERQAELIRGGLGGHMVINCDADGKPSEIVFMNTADMNTATQCLRINLNGIQFSAGYNALPDTAWTLDGGFNASYITTGHLDAARVDTGTLTANIIKAGVLQDQNSKNQINMETGEIHLTIGSGDTISGVPTTAEFTALNNQLTSRISSVETTSSRHYIIVPDAAHKITGWAASTDLQSLTTFEENGIHCDYTSVSSSTLFLSRPALLAGTATCTLVFKIEFTGTVTTINRQRLMQYRYQYNSTLYAFSFYIEVTNGEVNIESYDGTQYIPDSDGSYTITISKSVISDSGTRETFYLFSIPGVEYYINTLEMYISTSEYRTSTDAAINQKLGAIELSVSQLQEGATANYIPSSWANASLEDWSEGTATYPLVGTTYNNSPSIDMDGVNVTSSRWGEVSQVYNFSLTKPGTYTYSVDMTPDTAISPSTAGTVQYGTYLLSFYYNCKNPDTTDTSHPYITGRKNVNVIDQQAGETQTYSGQWTIPETVTYNGYTAATELYNSTSVYFPGTAGTHFFYIPLTNVHYQNFSVVGSSSDYAKAILDITESRIQQEVTRATGAEGTLQSQITLNANGLSSKVDSNGVISAINQSAEAVTINANKINLNGAVTANNYFKINADGSMTCTNGSFTGTVSGGSIVQTVSGATPGGNGGTATGTAYIQNGIVTAGEFKFTNGAFMRAEGYDTFYTTGVLFGHVSTYGGLWVGQGSSDSYMASIRAKCWARGYYSLTGEYLSGSDERLKTDIIELSEEKSTDLIYNMRPVSYVLKADTKKRIHHGFIAQDVERLIDNGWDVIGRVEDIDSKETYLTLNYTEFISDIVATLQSQNNRIKALEAEIAKLKEAL